MKKVMAIITLVLICSCVFASHKVSASINPYAYQMFIRTNGNVKERVNTRFGFGTVLSYDWKSDKGFRAGADLKAATYSFEDKNDFTDLTVLAKAGYVLKINESIGLYGNVKAGVDLQVYEDNTSAVAEFGPEIGLEFKVTKHMNLLASCEGLFGLSEKGSNSFRAIRITPAIGIGYTF